MPHATGPGFWTLTLARLPLTFGIFFRPDLTEEWNEQKNSRMIDLFDTGLQPSSDPDDFLGSLEEAVGIYLNTPRMISITVHF